ncbi:MAG: cyclic nucleotide-binding domain-containing protein [Deltaproteobacteria bacterium]|nr:cyclic nucleotide-binding domain-containing protein [Deltaproteobacteria bacterium]
MKQLKVGAVDDLSQLEREMDQHLKNNETKAAVQALYQLIVEYAKRREFEKAESLREKLIAVDSMALSEIVTTAEIIEEEKNRSKPKDHLKTWENLYGMLTREESNALYYSLKDGEGLGTDTLFRQGGRNSNLYFLNEGQLILLCNQGGKEVALKMVRPGEIAGEDTFFYDSLCTATLRTFTHARFNYLERDVLAKWKDSFPALEGKLRDYCARLEKVNDLLERKGLDRRSEKRYGLPGRGVIQVINQEGVPVSSAFKGELADISANGCCFYVKLSRKETARLLLGRRLILKFVVSVGKYKLQIQQAALVVAVRAHPFDDYTVHVKFDKRLQNQLIENLAGLAEMAANQTRSVTLH